MINIAICDDQEVSIAIAKQMCEVLIPELTVEGFSISTFDNPLDMLAAIERKGSFDLILCDILMPGLTGTEAIKELRDLNDQSHVIFLTSSSDHALEAFDVQADGYLLKPVDYDKFSKVVGNAIRTVIDNHKGFISVKERMSIRRISFSEIVYTEASGHNQIIHMVDGDTARVRSPQKALFEQLKGDNRFFRLGASFIVNLDAVNSVSGFEIVLNNGEQLKIPDRLVKSFKEAFKSRFLA